MADDRYCAFKIVSYQLNERVFFLYFFLYSTQKTADKEENAEHLFHFHFGYQEIF